MPPTADDTPLASVEVSTTGNVQLIAQWDKDKSSAKALLTHCIPDLTLMCIYNKPSVKEHWDTIVEEYSSKGSFAQADLWVCFMESRCPEKENVHNFLDGLHV